VHFSAKNGKVTSLEFIFPAPCCEHTTYGTSWFFIPISYSPGVFFSLSPPNRSNSRQTSISFPRQFNKNLCKQDYAHPVFSRPLPASHTSTSGWKRAWGGNDILGGRRPTLKPFARQLVSKVCHADSHILKKSGCEGQQPKNRGNKPKGRGNCKKKPRVSMEVLPLSRRGGLNAIHTKNNPTPRTKTETGPKAGTVWGGDMGTATV